MSNDKEKGSRTRSCSYHIAWMYVPFFLPWTLVIEFFKSHELC